MKLHFILAIALMSSPVLAGEHGGKEHGGKEHGGKEHGGKSMTDKEICVKTKSGKRVCGKYDGHRKKRKKGQSSLNENQRHYVSVKRIKDALMKHIKDHTVEGIFAFNDYDRKNKNMKLRFVKIHDPVRYMEKKDEFFACTDFEIEGQKGKLHDVDFWLVETNEGLKVVKTKVHKDPVKISGKWVKKPRYTFLDEDIVPIKK